MSRSCLPARVLAVAFLMSTGGAQAGEAAIVRHHARHLLPPVAGTLRMQEGDFGRAAGMGAANSPAGWGADRRARSERWYGDGTGLVGLLARQQGQVRDTWPRQPDRPLEVTYGEPDLWAASTGYGYRFGGASPGGLAYYNSGSPGSLAYYSSGSSAGPYGSPGGLAVYSSGAYGPGPSIIHLRRHLAYGAATQGCRCGPHIIRLGRGGDQ